MRTLVGLLAATGLLAACSSGELPPHYTDIRDGSPPAADGERDLLLSVDLYPPLRDGGGGTDKKGGCVLGTADNCTYCGHVCPGTDSATTIRVCLSGTCDIQCKGEYYDVNATISDGCELVDDLPLHENKLGAYSLGDVKDCEEYKKTSGVIPSDGRKHLVAPTDRLNGREDWYKLHIQDTFGCVVEAKVQVDLSAFPTGAQYKTEAYYSCDNGTQLATTTKNASGGQTVSLEPSTSCTFLGDDSGVLYLRLAKTSGSHSNSNYSVNITP